MKKTVIETFSVVGIEVRTSNQNGQSAQDIPALWGRFMSENIASKIPNKINDTVYCMYTNYEKDHTAPYTTILGCRVASLQTIPDGMVGKTIETANYSVHEAKGNLMQGAVFKTWQEIWSLPLKRAFVADFEVYDEKAKNPENAEIAIFVGLV